MLENIFFVLVDGLSDLLREKTPLREAAKPNISSILSKSIVAKFWIFNEKTWPKSGYASVSQYANFSILGYDIRKLNIKRGVIEAIGSDLEYKNGWLAIRVDFGCVDNNLIVIDRRVGRNIYGIDKIVEDFNKIDFNVPFILKRTYGHRGVLILKEKLSDEITNSDPLENNKRVNFVLPTSKKKKAKESAKIVQDLLEKFYFFAKKHEINKKRKEMGLLEVNYLLTREAGNKLPKVPNFLKKYRFRNGIVISENGVIKGSCKIAGFNSLTVEEMELENQFKFIFEKALELRKKYQIIYMHIKGADEAAHDKNCEKKKSIIEKIDEHIGYLLNNVNFENSALIITGDHITDCITGKHEYGFVPILIYSEKINGTKAKNFSEIDAYKSKKEFRPKNLWNFLKKL
ncbi:MAG: hypothetical protein QXO40_01325 [Candidatus Aenigmatarchaeota archaeon]